MIDLKPFCGEYVMADPFRLDFDGKPYACATDDHLIVCVKGENDLEPPIFKAGALWEQYRPDVSVSFSDLVTFAGPIDEDTSRECPECGGDGDCKCTCGDEHTCGECNGTGTIGTAVPIRIGLVNEIPFNLNLIAKGLTIGQAETVNISTVEPGKTAGILFVVATSWRIAVASLNPGAVATDENTPRFEAR